MAVHPREHRIERTRVAVAAERVDRGRDDLGRRVVRELDEPLHGALAQARDGRGGGRQVAELAEDLGAQHAVAAVRRCA